MNIQDILQVEQVTQINQNHLDTITELKDNGQRAEAYLYYAQLIGDQDPEALQQLMMQAQITTYSGVIGGAAVAGNFEAKINNQNDYDVSLDRFSEQIIEGMVAAIQNQINNGNSGILTADQIQTADQAVWAGKQMPDYFPGNFQLSLDPNQESDTSAFFDAYLLSNAALQGGALGKRESEFSDVNYDTVIENGYEYKINKSNGIIEGVFPTANATGAMNSLANFLNENILSNFPSAVADVVREEKWKYLGANDKSGASIYDPINGLIPGTTPFNQTLESIQIDNDFIMYDDFIERIVDYVEENYGMGGLDFLSGDIFDIFGELPALIKNAALEALAQSSFATALTWGDPHLVTFDGLNYDFQAPGEFVLVESTDPNMPFEIQVRHELVAGSNSISLNKATAMDIDGHKVGVYVEPNNDPSSNSDFIVMQNQGTIDALEGNDTVFGSNQADDLTGGAGSDILIANPANDNTMLKSLAYRVDFSVAA